MENETKPLSVHDALALESLRLRALIQKERAQIAAWEAQIEVNRIQEEFDMRVQELAGTYGTVGWALDLDNKQWVIGMPDASPSPDEDRSVEDREEERELEERIRAEDDANGPDTHGERD